MAVLITIIFYIVLGAYELIPLYKQKQYRDLFFISFLSVGSFTLALLLAVGIALPSPSEPLKQLVTFIIRR